MLQQFIAKFQNRRINDLLWWGAAAWLVGFVYLRGAPDWEVAYLPATLGDYVTAPLVANPPYILFLFYPLSILPPRIGGVILALINLVCLFAASRITGANKWLLLLSFPALIVTTFGQIDGLVALGAVIGSVAVRKNSGLLLGLAFLLLGLKPQVGCVLVIVYLVWMLSEGHCLDAGIATGVCVGVVGLSFLAFGFWLPDWINKIVVSIITGGDEFTSFEIGLFPFGLVALAGSLCFAREDVPAILTGTLLASPYAGYYSLVSALAFPLPWFVYCLTWLPVFLPTKMGVLVAPIAVILVGILQNRQKRPLKRPLLE